MKKEDLKVGMQVETIMSYYDSEEPWGIGTVLALGKTHAFVSYLTKQKGIEEPYYYEKAEPYESITKIINMEETKHGI